MLNWTLRRERKLSQPRATAFTNDSKIASPGLAAVVVI
jgi:hypothetical protein